MKRTTRETETLPVWTHVDNLSAGRSLAARVADRSRWPRKWWWPLAERIDLAGGIELIKKEHDDVSTSINTLLVSLLTYIFLFCATILSESDAELLSNSARIKLPVADVEMSVTSFFLTAPLVLIAFSFYLHVFVGHWVRLSKQLAQARSDSTVKFRPLPFIFNLDSSLATFFSNFLFYWLVPIVLAWFTWKSLPRASGFSVALYTGVILIVLLLLQLRRRPDGTSRVHSTVLWIALFFSVYNSTGFLLSILFGFPVVSRPVDLSHANLSHRDLRSVQLVSADMRSANLAGADLAFANLAVANLTNAILTGADLRNADLGAADLTNTQLIEVNLTNTILTGAKLTGAELIRATLTGTKLQAADLRAADLHEVKGLLQYQIDEALGNSSTRLPEGISTPKSWIKDVIIH